MEEISRFSRTIPVSFLKGNRTRYRNLLDKELVKGRQLLEIDSETYDRKVLLNNVNNCIKRLNDFQQKLEVNDERLSTVIEGQDGEQENVGLIKDRDYISTVMDCRDELAALQMSLQEQGSPRENSSSVSMKEVRFESICTNQGSNATNAYRATAATTTTDKYG